MDARGGDAPTHTTTERYCYLLQIASLHIAVERHGHCEIPASHELLAMRRNRTSQFWSRGLLSDHQSRSRNYVR